MANVNDMQFGFNPPKQQGMVGDAIDTFKKRGVTGLTENFSDNAKIVTDDFKTGVAAVAPGGEVYNKVMYGEQGPPKQAATPAPTAQPKQMDSVINTAPKTPALPAVASDSDKNGTVYTVDDKNKVQKFEPDEAITLNNVKSGQGIIQSKDGRKITYDHGKVVQSGGGQPESSDPYAYLDSPEFKSQAEFLEKLPTEGAHLDENDKPININVTQPSSDPAIRARSGLDKLATQSFGNGENRHTYSGQYDSETLDQNKLSPEIIERGNAAIRESNASNSVETKQIPLSAKDAYAEAQLSGDPKIIAEKGLAAGVDPEQIAKTQALYDPAKQRDHANLQMEQELTSNDPAVRKAARDRLTQSSVDDRTQVHQAYTENLANLLQSGDELQEQQAMNTLDSVRASMNRLGGDNKPIISPEQLQTMGIDPKSNPYAYVELSTKPRTWLDNLRKEYQNRSRNPALVNQLTSEFYSQLGVDPASRLFDKIVVGAVK